MVMKMAKFSLFFVGLVAATQLAGCVDGVQPYVKSPDTVIATAHDSGRDSGVLEEGHAAIAYDGPQWRAAHGYAAAAGPARPANAA